MKMLVINILLKSTLSYLFSTNQFVNTAILIKTDWWAIPSTVHWCGKKWVLVTWKYRHFVWNGFLPVATFHFQPGYRECHKWLCSAYRWRGRSLHADPAGSLSCSISTLVSETVSKSQINRAPWQVNAIQLNPKKQRDLNKYTWTWREASQIKIWVGGGRKSEKSSNYLLLCFLLEKILY